MRSHERLRRLDPADVETLLILSLSTDLGAADVAATLDLTRRAPPNSSTGPAGRVWSSRRTARRSWRPCTGAGTDQPGAGRHHNVETALLRTHQRQRRCPISWH